MGYIYEQRMSQETKDYLESLHLKTKWGEAFDYRRIGSTIVEVETFNIFFALGGHLEYPLYITDYILVYKSERVIMEVEDEKIPEYKVRSIRIPEAIEKEKDDVVKTASDLFFKYQKKFVFKDNKETTDNMVLNMDNIRYLK